MAKRARNWARFIAERNGRTRPSSDDQVEGRRVAESEEATNDAMRARRNIVRAWPEPECVVVSRASEDVGMRCHAGEVQFVGVDEAPYDVVVRLAIDEDSARRRVAGVTVVARDDGPGVSARGLQSLRIGRFVEMAGEQLSEVDDDSIPPRRAVGVGAERMRQSVDHVVAPKPGRPIAILDEELQLVAKAYKDAVRRGKGRRAAVAQALQRSRFESSSVGAVKRRVAMARARGLIPQASGTRGLADL